MSLSQEVAQLFGAYVNNVNLRITGLQPAAGVVGVTVTCGKAAFGVYATVVAVSTITDPSWLVGFTLSTAADTTDAAAFNRQYDIAIATGTAGSEVDIAVGSVGLVHNRATAAGEWESIWPPIMWPIPVKLAGAPRIAARGATDDGAATHAISVKAILATALG